MEIEAKFRIPNVRAAQELAAVERVGDYTLGPEETVRVRDTFYDTATGLLERVRHVFRARRREDGMVILTLKGMTRSRGPVHSRSEREITVPGLTRGELSASDLPDGELRRALEDLVGPQPLKPFLRVRQARRVRPVRRRRRIVGEWSVDRVEFRAANRRRTFYELEIELKHSGTRKELGALVAEVRHTWSLQAVREGKFLRALKFTREHPSRAGGRAGHAGRAHRA